MPSLKKFREMTGLPDTVRRWNDAAKIVKAGQQSLVAQEAKVPESRTQSATSDGTEIWKLDAKVREAVSKPEEAPVTERPEEIQRDGVNYSSLERLLDWDPHVAKHLDAVPLAAMLLELGLKSFEENGTTYLEQRGDVSNAYYNFEHEGETYDKYLIPVPDGWVSIEGYRPEWYAVDRWIGLLEPHMKSSISKGFVAPLTVIEDFLARMEARPLTWNFTPESWLIPKSFRDREVGIPDLLESYEIPARKGRAAVPAEPVPDEVRAWYQAEYGSKAMCEACAGEGTVFDRKTYRVDYCTTCDARGTA